MMKNTTIQLKGKAFPLYETKRGAFDMEMAGFTMKGISEGKTSDLQAYVFFSAKACAKREGINFPYSTLEKFVDDEEVDLMKIGAAFLALMKKQSTDEGDEPGEALPEQSPA